MIPANICLNIGAIRYWARYFVLGAAQIFKSINNARIFPDNQALDIFSLLFARIFVRHVSQGGNRTLSTQQYWLYGFDNIFHSAKSVMDKVHLVFIWNETACKDHSFNQMEFEDHRVKFDIESIPYISKNSPFPSISKSSWKSSLWFLISWIFSKQFSSKFCVPHLSGNFIRN